MIRSLSPDFLGTRVALRCSGIGLILNQNMTKLQDPINIVRRLDYRFVLEYARDYRVGD